MVTFTFISLDWSMCSLSSQGFPIIGLYFLFTPHYSFCHCIIHLLSVFFPKHNLDQIMPLSKILQWLPIACRIKSPLLSLCSKLSMIQTQHAFPCSSPLIITPCTGSLSQWFSNLNVLQTHLEGFLECVFLGLMPSVSDLVSLEWGLEIVCF